MSRLNIDGQSINFEFKHANDGREIYANVMNFLKDNNPFILHDGNRKGPIFIPSKLACINMGEILIHSGVSEFQFSLSWEVGLYEMASELMPKELTYMENKLLPYAAIVDHTP